MTTPQGICLALNYNECITQYNECITQYNCSWCNFINCSGLCGYYESCNREVDLSNGDHCQGNISLGEIINCDEYTVSDILVIVVLSLIDTVIFYRYIIFFILIVYLLWCFKEKPLSEIRDYWNKLFCASYCWFERCCGIRDEINRNC